MQALPAGIAPVAAPAVLESSQLSLEAPWRTFTSLAQLMWGLCYIILLIPAHLSASAANLLTVMPAIEGSATSGIKSLLSSQLLRQLLLCSCILY